LNFWATPGLVLSARPYLEADKLVQIYTRQFGKIRARAKGARKPKSRFSSALELFTESSLAFAKPASGDLYLLTQAKLLNGFPRLKEDFGTITLLQILADILQQSLQEGEPDEELYRLLKEALEALQSQSECRESVLGVFILRFLEGLGHPLELEVCAECGKSLGSTGAFLIPHRGGALGLECSPSGPGGARVSPRQLAILRRWRSLPWERLAVLKMGKAHEREMLFILLAYLEKTIEKPLRSVDYYRSVLPV